MTITLSIAGDALVEAHETFALRLQNPLGAQLGADLATVTITNDDLPSVSVADVSKDEGNSGSTAFVFTAMSRAKSPWT